MADTHVYIDESGDLGFKFDRPFRKGGSSRYLTIAFLLIPKDSTYLIKRIVRSIYKKRKQQSSKELKGSELTFQEKEYIVKNTVVVLEQNPDISIFAMTVYKENVRESIQKDANKLYNYMIRLILLDKIVHRPTVERSSAGFFPSLAPNTFHLC